MSEVAVTEGAGGGHGQNQCDTNRVSSGILDDVATRLGGGRVVGHRARPASDEDGGGNEEGDDLACGSAS